MKKKTSFFRQIKIGLLLLVVSFSFLWPPMEKTTITKQPDIELQLATAKEGDVLAFRDGKSCQVLRDRIPGSPDIQYVCSNEPLAVLSTPVQSLAVQLSSINLPSQAGMLDWLAMPWGKDIQIFRF